MKTLKLKLTPNMTVTLKKEIRPYFSRAGKSIPRTWRRTLADIDAWDKRLKGLRSNCSLKFDPSQADDLQLMIGGMWRRISASRGWARRGRDLLLMCAPPPYYDKKQSNPLSKGERLLKTNTAGVFFKGEYLSPGSIVVEVSRRYKANYYGGCCNFLVGKSKGTLHRGATLILLEGYLKDLPPLLQLANQA